MIILQSIISTRVNLSFKKKDSAALRTTQGRKGFYLCIHNNYGRECTFIERVPGEASVHGVKGGSL